MRIFYLIVIATVSMFTSPAKATPPVLPNAFEPPITAQLVFPAGTQTAEDGNFSVELFVQAKEEVRAALIEVVATDHLEFDETLPAFNTRLMTGSFVGAKINGRILGDDYLFESLQLRITYTYKGEERTMSRILPIQIGYPPLTLEEAKIQDLAPDIKIELCPDNGVHYNCMPLVVDAIKRDDLETVKKIIEDQSNDIDPNTRFAVFFGMTPFMEAVDAGRLEIASYLLKQGADPSLRTPFDPVKEAELKGYDQLLKEINQLDIKR